MRLFITIGLSPKMKTAIRRFSNNLRAKGVTGRFTPPERLHLTLAFLGECERGEPVLAAMRQLNFKPLEIKLYGCGNFGNLFWVGVESSKALMQTAADLRSALASSGILFEGKTFKPHITVIRNAQHLPKEPVEVPSATMVVRFLSLMKSEQIDGHLRYTELARVAN